MFNLGLKEAKELVEKAPIMLKNKVPKEQAEQMKNKLTENGGVIELN
jgi:large subunit ribosomal protein L7/L12